MPRGVYNRSARAPVKTEPAAEPPEVEVRAHSMAPIGIRKFPRADVRGLSGDELRAYAAQVGVRRHDIDNLTEDRLRANVAMAVAQMYEHLTE